MADAVKIWENGETTNAKRGKLLLDVRLGRCGYDKPPNVVSASVGLNRLRQDVVDCKDALLAGHAPGFPRSDGGSRLAF